MGQNGRWRRAMVDHIAPTSPDLILDVASGTAGVALQLVSRTSSDVVGVDLTMNMLARGRENVANAGVSERVSLVAGRAEQLPFPDGTFDAALLAETRSPAQADRLAPSWAGLRPEFAETYRLDLLFETGG